MNLDWNIPLSSQDTLVVKQVFEMVHATVIEEYCEQVLLKQEQDENILCNADQNVNVGINLNASAWHHNEEAGDNLIVALNFLDTAYTCLNCEVVFQSLMMPVEVNVDANVDANINANINVSHHDETQIESECTIIEALLFLVTKEEDGKSFSDGSWNKVQQLALSVLTKAMLCAEYIQMYSSSMSILPEDGVDSLFGVGMGLGLEHYRMRSGMGEMYRQVMLVLETDVMSNDDCYEAEKSYFRLSCMGMLALLHRTNFIDVSTFTFQGQEQIQNQVMKNLHNAVEGFEKQLTMSQTTRFKNDTSNMALSVLALVQYKHSMETEQKIEVKDSTLEHTLNRVFECNSKELHAGATHVIIHLCISKNNCLRRFTKTQPFGKICAKGFQSLFIFNDSWRNFRELSFALVHLNTSFGSSLRKAINTLIKNESESYLFNLVKMLLHSTTTRSLSLATPALLLLKSLMLQSTVNGQWQLRDDLARTTWKVLFEDSTLIKSFAQQLQAKSDDGDALQLQMMLDMLNFLHDNGRFGSKSSIAIEDVTPTLVKIVKGSGASKDTPDAVRYSLQVSAATTLSCLFMHTKGDNSATIKRTIQGFALNSPNENIYSQGSVNVPDGGFEYALCQSLSRDLLRRALSLQSMLPLIIGEDSVDVASILFSSKVDISAANNALRERVERQAKELQIVCMQKEKLGTERDALSKQYSKSKHSTDRELRHRLAAARIDAMDIAAANEDEHNHITEELDKLQQDLGTANKKAEMAVQDADQDRLVADKKLKEYKCRLADLDKQLGASEQKLDRYKHEYLEKESSLDGVLSQLNKTQLKLDKIKAENAVYVHENGDVKGRLEESLGQLISLTLIYNTKEKEFGSERNILIDKLRLAKSDMEQEGAERHRIEDKYSFLKEKYQVVKQKYQNEVRRREEERTSRHENERTEQKKQREEEKSKRTLDGRRPMGNLDFMNSFHDTSLRSEKSGMKSMSSRNIIGKQGGSKKKSSFRIIAK